MQVLTTYASKYGATAEIAARIAEVLREAGLAVTLRPAAQISEVTPYDAVIFGSAIYAGRWLREGVRLLERHAAALAARPLWLFSSGPTGAGEPVAALSGWRYPEAQAALIARLKPRDIALFHGKLVLEQLNLGERLIIRALQAEPGDFRDWGEVTAWARGIAVALTLPQVATGAAAWARSAR